MRVFLVQDMKTFGQNWPVFHYEVCRVYHYKVRCQMESVIWNLNCGGLGQWIPGVCRLRMRLSLRVEARLMRRSADWMQEFVVRSKTNEYAFPPVRVGGYAICHFCVGYVGKLEQLFLVYDYCNYYMKGTLKYLLTYLISVVSRGRKIWRAPIVSAVRYE